MCVYTHDDVQEEGGASSSAPLPVGRKFPQHSPPHADSLRFCGEEGLGHWMRTPAWPAEGWQSLGGKLHVAYLGLSCLTLSWALGGWTENTESCGLLICT